MGVSARREARTPRNRSRVARHPIPGAGRHVQYLSHQNALHEFRTRPDNFYTARPVGAIRRSAFPAWYFFGTVDAGGPDPRCRIVPAWTRWRRLDISRSPHRDQRVRPEPRRTVARADCPRPLTMPESSVPVFIPDLRRAI